MRGTTRRMRTLLAGIGLLYSLRQPLTAAASERPYTVYTTDGLALSARGPLLWLAERGAAERPAEPSMSFRLQPIAAPEADARDGDEVWIRAHDGRYLTRWGRWALLTRQPQRALRWRVVRADGAGMVGVGDSFALQTSDGRLELGARRGALVLQRAQSGSTPWSLGCYFDAGPFDRAWSSAAVFDVATGEQASEVARAVDWLRANTVNVRMPGGDLPVIVWDDPTLQSHPTVGYLSTDTLWAAKALEPYDPELSEDMQRGLIAAGWYGNGLHDALFHGIRELAHKPASSDVVHGTWLEGCAFSSPAVHVSRSTAQLYVPELSVDPAWTFGNSSQFIDSAVYSALNDYWHGEVERARARIRALITDHRGSGWDTMFWDNERWILVDQASRCDYDSVVGSCSNACPDCQPCQGDGCFLYNASYKLGLVLYAAKIMGLSDLPALADIEYRLWESQHDDGGLAHVSFYAPDATLARKTGSTGEATAIAVLASSVVQR